MIPSDAGVGQKESGDQSPHSKEDHGYNLTFFKVRFRRPLGRHRRRRRIDNRH